MYLCTCNLSDVVLNKENIQRSISAMSTYAASGLEQIPAIVFKKCLHTIWVPLIHLWRTSLDTRSIPSSLKQGKITPIYKGRPVALTSHIIKIFEITVTKQIHKYMEQNQLFNDTQHGFSTGRSCESQLLQHRFDIITTLENEATADVIYLDFAKGFDEVDHNVLLQKLEHIGNRGKLLNWIRCFFTNCNQSVVVEGVESDTLEVLSGVAQGSVIRLIMFLISIGDIDNNMTYCMASPFADDTRLLGSIKTDYKYIQDDLDIMYNWAENNNMSFNSSKFEMIRYRHPKSDICNPHYTTPDGSVIHQNNQIRDFGVTMSENSDFSMQIDYAAKKSRQIIGWILRSFKSR